MNSLIVLNWNTTQLLIGMYLSAKENAAEKFNTIIVDNGSREEELRKLNNYFCNEENITVVRLPKNIGFAAGNNVGLNEIKSFSFWQKIKCKNVFFINSDIVIEEKNWDIKLTELKDSITGSAYHPLRWSKDARFQIQPIPTTPVESESVQGAFFSIPFHILEEVKERDGCWFDENFKFAHYEETDLQLRIMQLGYKCYWVPIKHVHLHNSSSTKSNGYKLCDEIQNEQQFKANSEKNRQLLLKKHVEFFKAKL